MSAALTGEAGAVVRAVVGAYRGLTGGSAVRDSARRVLVACSGGADSSALAIALAAGSDRFGVVLGHVVHDLRGEAEALADRDAVRDLAERLGVGFVEGRAVVSGDAGNDEANARRVRYRELERMAGEAGVPFVVTGHHAEDQLETLLMRLSRGAGPTGLSGIAPMRRLSEGVTLVRPMLSVSRADAEAVCAASGWRWREDATNADISRTRAAIRATVVPALKAVRPDAAVNAERTARACRAASESIRERAEGLMRSARREGDAWAWSAADLTGVSGAEVHALLRLATRRHGEGRGLDRLTASATGPVVRAALGLASDNSGGPKSFVVGGLEVRVSGAVMTLRVRGA